MQLVLPCPIEDKTGQLIARRVDRRSAHTVDRLRDAVRREDRQAFLVGRNDHHEQPRGRLGAILLVERERGLVAVVAVGDQELRVLQLLGQRVAELRVEPPELRVDAAFVDGEVRLAEAVDPRSCRPRAGRSARAVCASRAAGAAGPPSGRRACARAGGRRALVRLDVQRGDEALARALDAVGPDVILREPPVRRLRVLTSTPDSRQAARSRAACSSESGSVRWTTLCGLRAQELGRCSSEMTSYGGATTAARSGTA